MNELLTAFKLAFFYLRKRFNTFATKTIIVMMLLGVGMVVYADVFVEQMTGNTRDTFKIHVVDDDILVDEFNKYGLYDKESSIHLYGDAGNYQVTSKTPLNQTQRDLIYRITMESLTSLKANIIYEETQSNLNVDLVFTFVSMAYFSLLSFPMISISELQLEKTTHIDEQCVALKAARSYYLSKLFCTCLYILNNMLIGIMIVVLISLSRVVYDNFEGLIAFAKFLTIIPISVDTISSFIEYLNSNRITVYFSVYCFVLYFLCVIQVQSLLIILQRRLKTNEELNQMQIPIYVLMILLYYLSIFIYTNQFANKVVICIIQSIPLLSFLHVTTQHALVGTALHVRTYILLINLFWTCIAVKTCLLSKTSKTRSFRG